MVEAVLNRSDDCKGKVIVIRYEGPKGGPGMPEMLSPTSVIKSAGLGEHSAKKWGWIYCDSASHT